MQYTLTLLCLPDVTRDRRSLRSRDSISRLIAAADCQYAASLIKSLTRYVRCISMCKSCPTSVVSILLLWHDEMTLFSALTTAQNVCLFVPSQLAWREAQNCNLHTL